MQKNEITEKEIKATPPKIQEDIKLYEIDEIAAHIKKQCRENVNLIVGNTIEKIEDGKIRVSLLASGIAAENSDENSKQAEKNEEFNKPRLVSSRDNFSKNSAKESFNNNIKSKQGDLEDFLSQELRETTDDNKDNAIFKKVADSNKNEFFIPKEEAIPNQEKSNELDPFKEADVLNANKESISDLDNNEDDEESVSLISRLTNVKEKKTQVLFMLKGLLQKKRLQRLLGLE